MTTTFTSREFNQDSAGAKRAAAKGPVFISDRGRPAHVLMTIEDYRRLVGPAEPLSRRLAWPGAGEAELPVPDRRANRDREIDLN